MEKPSETDLTRLETRFMASSRIVDAKMKEYGALLMVGDPEERERIRTAVLLATEAMLDRHEDYVCATLQASGIDPFTRHIGPEFEF